MTVTLGVIEVGVAVLALLFGLFMHAQSISKWRAQIEQQVRFLIDEDKRIHNRIEKHNEKVLNKLEDIASDLKKVELWMAGKEGAAAVLRARDTDT